MPERAAAGATPQGVSDEKQAAGWVRNIFAEIAPRYDLANHLLSFNIDRSWRKRLRDELAPVLANRSATVLDLCCGTGDVLLDLQTGAAARMLGADFCHPMLLGAQSKAARKQQPARLFEGDALQLPLADASLEAISIAFGFRNLANYTNGLTELSRVLRPGGMLCILEFSHPPNTLVRAGYGAYSRLLLPALGALISGSREAYAYLPDSIGKFPRAPELRSMMENAGFTSARFQLLSGGIAALHTGCKSTPAGAG